MVKIDPSQRVSTGIDKLNEITNGGFIKNTVNLLSGPAGCGKTSFCLSFLYDGAKKGENGLYVSLEEQIDGLKAAAASIGFDEFDKLLQENKIVIFDVGKMKLDEGFEDFMSVDNILQHIQTLTKASGVHFDRVVIDSVSALSPTYETEGALRKAIFKLFMYLREGGVTTLVTGEVDEKDKTTRFGEGYLADSIVRLSWQPKVTEAAVYKIFIPKLRYSSKSNKEYQYNITDNGINISSEGISW